MFCLNCEHCQVLKTVKNKFRPWCNELMKPIFYNDFEDYESAKIELDYKICYYKNIGKKSEYDIAIDKIVEIFKIDFFPTYQYNDVLKVLINLVKTEIENMENK